MGKVLHLATSRTQFSREQALLAAESFGIPSVFRVAQKLAELADQNGKVGITTERLATLTRMKAAAAQRALRAIRAAKLFVETELRCVYLCDPGVAADLAKAASAFAAQVNANAKQHYREASEEGSFAIWREEFGRICRPGNSEIGPTPKKENQAALVAFGQRLAAELNVDERAVAAATCERFSKETDDPKVRAEKILPFMVPLLWKFEPSVRHALRRPPAVPARSYHVELAAPSVAENSAFARQALASLAGGAS